ncbi:MAG: DNA primase [Phycisphaeraceae bacterium]|nr:DNA primase [Phycisphaeraceae bacterium]
MTTGPGYVDDRQRVLEATDLVQLVGEHVALRPKGREFVGLCPFHDDHSPSMHVVPHKGIFHCFACGAGGDALTFVRNFHKMSFREALEHLAQRARITLTPRRHSSPGADEAARSARESLLAANLTACDFFRTILRHEEHGKGARDLIARRGIPPEMVREFDLGAAPAMWDGLVKTIDAKRMKHDAFVAAGLLKRRENGGSYDAFRDRLIFPIHDQIGRVIAFGGRRLSDAKRPDGTEDAKYLNSAESPVFDKGATLYGLHQAARAIQSSRTAIVVEGYIDVIACHAAGVRNVVATLGTAMTAGNARLLRRQCEAIVLLFDGDEAGQRAAQRAVEVFFSERVDLRIARLSDVTDAKDPDELLKREGGAATFREAIARAVDPFRMLLSRVESEMSNRGVAAQSRIVEEFIARLADLGLDRIEPAFRQMIVRRLSQLTGVESDVLFGSIGSRTDRAGGQRRSAGSVSDSTHEPPERRRRMNGRERLIGCLLCDPQLVHALSDRDRGLIWPPDSRATKDDMAVSGAVEQLVHEGEPPSLAAVLSRLEDVESQHIATWLASEVDRLAERNLEAVRRLWKEWLDEARRGHDGVSAPPSSGWDDAAARLESLRRRAADVGTDRRAMPRAS